MHVTSGYVWKSASCPHMPTLLMNSEWCWMRSKVILFRISCLLLSLISILTVYLICFLTLLLFMMTVQKWERTEGSGSRTHCFQPPKEAGRFLTPVVHPLNSLFIEVLYVSNILWKFPERTGSAATYIFGFLSPPHTWSHAFYLLLQSFLSLSLASALLPADEYMNEIKTLGPAHTHTHMLLLQRVAHNRGAHKDLISSILCECLLTPLNSLLFLVWGLNSVKEFSHYDCC